MGNREGTGNTDMNQKEVVNTLAYYRAGGQRPDGWERQVRD